MLEILALVGFGFVAIVSTRKPSEDDEIPQKITIRIEKLWDIANHGMRNDKLLRAEKALLTILKIDEKNASAYNRLGILYAKQKEYKDAIDCFEIASSIEPTASSLHNLGLIYYDTANYEKASQAFERALDLESGLAARHVAYAKVMEKLGNDKKMLDELERAAELEPNPESFTLLAKAYDEKGHPEEAEEIRQKLKSMVLPKNKPRRILRKRRVVV